MVCEWSLTVLRSASFVALLAPAYGWFKGIDTLDLKEAKALLHELA
jgi:hypothetical protein